MSTMLIKNNNNIVYKKNQLPKNFQNYSDFIAFSVFVSATHAKDIHRNFNWDQLVMGKTFQLFFSILLYIVCCHCCAVVVILYYDKCFDSLLICPFYCFLE